MRRLAFVVGLLIAFLGWTHAAQLGVFGERMAEHAEQINPVNVAGGLAVGIELRQIHDALQRHHLAVGLYPLDFRAFIDENFDTQGRDPAKDPWGTPYRYRLLHGGYELRSAGRDGLFDTADDYALYWGPDPPPADFPGAS